MNLSALIFNKLMLEHYGKVNAIKREFLLDWIHQTEDPDLTDRELRRIYSELPICVSEKGLFIPTTEEDLKEFKVYLERKAFPLFRRWKKIWEYYRDKIICEKQINLFD